MPGGLKADGRRLALRPMQTRDDAFCFDLFCRSRLAGEDFAGFEPSFRQRLLEQQYAGQTSGYRGDFPGAAFEIVAWGDVPIGRRVTAHAGSSVRLLDIALLPPWRGRGFGTALIRDTTVMAQAAGLPLDLLVAARNAQALRLYLRLGFVLVDDVPPHLALRHPGATH